MADLVAIHEALAETVVQGTSRDVRGYPFQTGGSYELPCVVVGPGEDWVNYHVDQGNECDVNLVLEVRARCAVSLEDGLRVLAELLSSKASLPNSVIDAILTDPSLGGVVDECVLGVPSPWVGFGATGDDALPHGVMVSIPVQVWTVRS